MPNSYTSRGSRVDEGHEARLNYGIWISADADHRRERGEHVGRRTDQAHALQFHGPIKINFDLTEQATLTQGRRLNKDAEIQALSLLIYWMESDAVTAAGSDLIFEYIHGGSGSHAATASLRLINEEESVRKVIGLSGWRRCVFLNDLMTKVVDDKRYPDLKSESEQLIRAMMDDGVMGD